MEITLDMLLASRDNRHNTQMLLMEQHPDKTLVCLTVIMPGRVKRNHVSLAIAHAAVASTASEFGSPVLERDLTTGYEAYFLTTLQPIEAKNRACDIEERHPLGRLFDIDVIEKDGSPLSRKAVGKDERKCLLCENDARYCMRNQTHSQEEILSRITQMAENYV